MTQASGAPRKRIYLINRDFQLRYTRSAVLVGLLTTVLTILLIIMPLFQLRIVRFPGFLPAPFLIGIAVAALCNFLIIAWLGIFMTHRIAGPMFSLVRHMRQVQAGSLFNDLRQRETDDLRYLVRNYNELIEYLIATARADLERLRTIREKVAAGAGAEAGRLLDEEIVRLETRLKKGAAKADEKTEMS
jgi:methyl-accepting chemotaxis protein